MNASSPNSSLSASDLKLNFLNQLRQILTQACEDMTDPSQLVEHCAPLLNRLILNHPDEVDELVTHLRWPAEGDENYTRQRILECEEGHWSIYVICWHPGQYTPIHDHGTWGVVGVLQGCLHEHQMAMIEHVPQDNLYRLTPAGVCLLSRGAINTFVPEPDHIHRSGVPESGQPTASIHLYGRVMTHYHVYDMQSGTRSQLDVE